MVVKRHFRVPLGPKPWTSDLKLGHSNFSNYSLAYQCMICVGFLLTYLTNMTVVSSKLAYLGKDKNFSQNFNKCYSKHLGGEHD